MSEGLTVRVVLIGDSQVGKTSLIHRFVRSSFEKQQKSTIGAVFHTYEQTLNGKPVVIQIWDTAGQEKYRSLGPIYYRNAAAGIAVFDMTEQSTLDGLEKWISEFRKYTENPLLFVVGNKTDLTEAVCVTEESVKEFAEARNGKSFFTSAKTGDNVKELFQAVWDELVKEGRIVADDSKKLEESKKNDKGCC